VQDIIRLKMPLVAGTKLDGYEVLGLLGAGGMGEVYRARDPVLKREVAIKVLPSYVSRDPDRLRRFEQEAQAAAALNHPNILAVHQFGAFEGAPYLVSELLEGSTLRQLLQRGPIPVRKAIDYGVQIAHGLAAAHEKGIVHRDLKPENLFVTKDGRVKILDFGLAKLIQRRPDPDGTAPTLTVGTDPGIVMGTAGYMSPEQVRGQTVDYRTDIFAFGAILYEMLSGKRAFQRSTSAETMTAILNDEPPSIISQVVQTAPPGLQRVIHRCLEKNPEQRFQSASDLAFALEALLDFGSTPTAALPQGSRSRWLSVAATGFAAVLTAALIVWWRTPPAIPVVESVTQLTDDGQPKSTMATEGSRIYFNEGPAGSQKLMQVSVAGGPTASLETTFPNCYLIRIEQDGSALMVACGNGNAPPYSMDPLWLVPLPAGEPRRLGDLRVANADILPDGRIVFAKLVPGADAKGTNGRADWFIAEKDGLNPRKLVSLPGYAGHVAAPPIGQRILLTQEQAGDRSLLEIKADGRGLREIRKLTDESSFRWSSDEKYVVYQSGNASQSDIWLLPMQTGLFRRPGKPVRLTNGPLPYSLPTPSRNGKEIFVLGTRQRGELMRYDMKSHAFLPFLSGISATDPTFSRDGKWVAYASYPDHTLWRSRSDGTERMQLTFPPMDVRFPMISPDGTKVSFHTKRNEIFVIDMRGGQPQKVTDDAVYASWSPDGNYLLYALAFGLQITDVRTGKNTAVPSSVGMGGGFWLNQDTMTVRSAQGTKFVIFNLKTQQRADVPGISADIENYFPSPNGKYLYYTTGGVEPKVLRYRFADHQIETMTSLKDLRRIVNFGYTQINVAPDGSPIFTRDTGYQEIYALNIRWP
jgi:eukaryotic-like serine/threonine-protein kinase